MIRDGCNVDRPGSGRSAVPSQPMCAGHMHMAPVAAGLEQREAQRIAVGDESAAGHAAAVAGGPMPVGVVLDLEMVGAGGASWDKVAHVELRRCFVVAGYKVLPP